jgi:hypothetical protein
MTYVLTLASLLTLFVLAGAHAATLAGVEMPETENVDGTTLRLNGMGLRQATALRVKAYVGGLYLEKPTSDGATVIDSHQLKRVSMKFLRDIDAKRLSSNWADSIRKAGGKSIEPSIARFASLLPDVKTGDVLSFTWRPAGGLETALDGTPRGTIAGDEFARALFTVWFGPEPGDESLKQGMLGTKSARK